MTRFLMRRLAWSLVVLWFVVTATFVIGFTLPADPARALVGPHGNAEVIQAVRAKLHLDAPLWTQYGAYVARVVRLDLGTSYRTSQPVLHVILARAWPTAQLALAALALQLLVGVPLGVVAALRRGRAADLVADLVGLVGQSAPTFFLGPLFMYLLALRLGWFPVSGYGEPGWDRAWHLALPAATLAAGGVAVYARVLRAELLTALGQDWARTARAKGLGGGAVVWRHAMRNALAPLVALAGLDLGVLLGGAVATEWVFGWPGLGREAVESILNVDLPIVLGVVLVAGVAILLASVVVDLVVAWLDPRVRLE